MVPQITNQQQFTLLSPLPPPPYNMFNIQSPQYPPHGSLLTHPSPPQLPLHQISQPTLHPLTPPIYIQPQSIQGTALPTPHTIPPLLPQTQTSNYSTLPLF